MNRQSTKKQNPAGGRVARSAPATRQSGSPPATPESPTAAPEAEAHEQVHVGVLGSLDGERLCRLLEVRPDLAAPPPGSMAELEERSLSFDSVFRALMTADVLVLQLAQILTLIGEKHVALADVHAMVGDVPREDFERGFSWLEERNLVVRLPSDELCVHVGLLSIGGAGALGPPAEALAQSLSAAQLQSVLGNVGRTAKGARKPVLVNEVIQFVQDQSAVRALVASSSQEVQALALRVASGSSSLRLPWGIDPYGPGAPPAGSASALWLVQRGLAYKDTQYTAVIPREVGLALRGGHPFPPWSYRRPPVLPRPPIAPPTGAQAVEAAAATVQAVEGLVDAWGSDPARLLKSDGIGVREVRRLARTIDLPERDTFRLVEVATAAGLIVADTRQRLAMPTTAGDEWLDLPAAERWWALARSWLETPMYPSLAGSTDFEDTTLPALGYYTDFDSEASGQRRTILDIMVEPPDASGVDRGSLTEVAVWDAPMLWSNVPRTPAEMVDWTLAEMELLALAVDGVPTPLASALLSNDFAAVRDLLADPGSGAWQLVLQADLTALVTGRGPAAVRAELEMLADVEARGSAILYRFSQGSVRRAFDAGRGSSEILAFLGEHAAKGIPQPLAYLVEDVGRRHGQARVGRAGCYVHFVDPALAAEVARGKRTSKLGFRQIAPTVLVCDQPEGRVLELLRKEGYLPVAESGDGSWVHTPVKRHRGEATPAPGRAPAGGPDTRALAAALRQTAGESPQGPAISCRTDGQGLEIPTLLRRPGGVFGEPARPGGNPELEFVSKLLEDQLGGVDAGATLLRELFELADEYLDEEDDDDEEDEEANVGFHHGGGRDRPTAIFHTPAEIADLVETAEDEEWLLRLSYTSAAGKSSEVSVIVDRVRGPDVTVQVAPRWTEQKYKVERINWARAMTEAEEESVW